MTRSPTFNGHNTWNASLWNGGAFSALVYSTDVLAFYDSTGAAFSLSDGSTMIMESLTLSGPTREIIGAAVPRDHGEYVNADYFRETVIEARGIVKKATAATLDAYLDTMKQSLRQREGYLDFIDQNSTVKRYVATVDNFDEMFADRQAYHVTICPWVVRFRCKTPFGRSRTYSTSESTITTSPSTLTISHSGTIRSQPVIILNFDAASSVTVVNVKRIDANGTTLEEIEYSGSISAGDVLKFDCEEKEVTKGSSSVTYTGSFLTLEPGSNLIKITVTGSSFSAYSTVKWKETYL